MEDTGAPTAPADDTIAALRVVRGIHANEPGPWTIPPTAIRGLALIVISQWRALATLQGITDEAAQDEFIRIALDGMHESATLAALNIGIGGTGE